MNSTDRSENVQAPSVGSSALLGVDRIPPTKWFRCDGRAEYPIGLRNDGVVHYRSLEDWREIWKEYAEASEPAACDTGRCFLVWVDWRAFDRKLTAMPEGHAVIAKWSGCSWMSQTDEDDSWSGPVKCVTHWARL